MLKAVGIGLKNSHRDPTGETDAPSFCYTVFSAAIVAPIRASGTQLLLAGCYERVYSGAHLAAHKSQIVTRATLLVRATESPMKAPGGGIIADGDLGARPHGAL